MIKKFLYGLISLKKVRRRLLFHLKQNFFHELVFSVPVKSGYRADLLETDSHDSFSEIFIQLEYENFLPDINFNKILDLGANYGYFSLWIQTINPDIKISSLMIESSKNCQRSLNSLIEQKDLKDRYQYMIGAIANPSKKSIDFFDRPYMASSIFKSDVQEISTKVCITSAEEISDKLPPPYDLIKCDIEGSEWDFLTYYPEILRKTQYLLLEWHSWHTGGGGFPQIENKITSLGFQIIKTSSPQKALGRDGEVGLFLAQNLNFQN